VVSLDLLLYNIYKLNQIIFYLIFQIRSILKWTICLHVPLTIVTPWASWHYLQKLTFFLQSTLHTRLFDLKDPKYLFWYGVKFINLVVFSITAIEELKSLIMHVIVRQEARSFLYFGIKRRGSKGRIAK